LTVGYHASAGARELASAESEHVYLRDKRSHLANERTRVEIAGCLAAREKDAERQGVGRLASAPDALKSTAVKSRLSRSTSSNAGNPRPFSWPVNADSLPTNTTDSLSGFRYCLATRCTSSTVTALTRSRNVCSCSIGRPKNTTFRICMAMAFGVSIVR